MKVCTYEAKEVWRFTS